MQDAGETDSTANTHKISERRGRTFLALPAAIVVVLVASVSVALTRSGGSGSNGGGLTIEALAATTQRQAARLIATVNLPTGTGEGSPASDCLLVSVGEPCGSSSDQTPQVLVATGLIDFRSGNGRIDFSTRNGSRGSLKRFATDLLVDGHVYGSINASTLDIPAEIRRTKRWIESKIQTERAGLNPFDPLAIFKDHHVKLDDLGRTRLGDQSVHHYHGVMRLPYAPQSTNGPTVTVTSTIDIYVDTHIRLARLRSVDQQPGFGTSTSQIDFSEYGVHVNITAPPADQVYSPPEDPSHT